MSTSEYITHFSMWAAVKSPLIISTDLRRISSTTLSILSNPAVLAISQDPLGQSAFRRWRYFVPDTDTNTAKATSRYGLARYGEET